MDATTVLGAENSEVPAEPVAVAVMALPKPTCFEGTKAKETLPSELVVTFFFPMNVLPSSPPVGLEN